MDTRDWITVGIAAITIISSWGQFWVKERLFTKTATASPDIDAMLKSRSFISLIAFTGILSGVSMWLLVVEVFSPESITEISCLKISILTVLSVLNMVLVQALITLRRIAILQKRIESAEVLAWLL